MANVRGTGDQGDRPRPPRRGGHPRAGSTHSGPPRGRASGGGPSRNPRSPGGPPSPRRRPSPPKSLRIVHEDDEILVVDKPPGIVTAHLMSQPGVASPRRESLFDMVKEHVRSARRRRGQGRVWIIHRLDKEASGLLIFAKSEGAYTWLKEEFRAKRVHRLYIAVVEGAIGEEADATTAGATAPEAAPSEHGRRRPLQLPAGTIQSFILEGGEGESARSLALGEVARGSMPPARTQARPEEGRGARGGRIGRGSARFAGDEGAGEARLAVTHYRVLASGQGRSLLQLRLETGRKNQIRVHMQEFRHPIIGDRRYGARTDPIGRLGLHASELGFTNQATGKAMRLTSPAPASFYRIVGMEPPAAAEEASAERGGASGDTSAIAPARKPAAETSWDSVAEWYDGMMEEEQSDHFQRVIMPGTLRLLHAQPGMRVMDVACGQGAICRRLAELGVEAIGVDAAPRLIEAARRRTEEAGLNVRYEVGDGRELEGMREALGAAERPFEAALCIMALMNLDPLEPVVRGAASLLKPGGVFVAVILHPAFRAPRQTSWGWEEADGDGQSQEGSRRREKWTKQKHVAPARVHQYRRVDGYLSPGQVAITMNPGYAAHGAEEVRTWTFHRPLQTYIKALADAGFVVELLEEWPSLRQSQPGPRAAEENRARREIPMFLGLRAVKR